MTAPLVQRSVFWNGEGDQWHLRNANVVSPPAIVPWTLGQLKLINNPTIVEIGCGEGHLISFLQHKFDARAIGLDVSDMALTKAKMMHPKVTFVRSSAHAINRYPCDLVIFGFCLYVVDRDYLFDLVSRVDIALNGGGCIAIHDFDPSQPQVVPYHHKEGIFSYKMDYAALWLANPQYELVSKTTTREGEALTIIRKGTWDRWL
jgi:SAM-dependent methyltransferase